MIELDGAEITGGGQILRYALALSAHTNKPFRIVNVRKGRPHPGLRPQHLHALKTLQRLCNADVEGGYVGSEEVSFVPRGFTPEDLSVHIGTAGSVTLVLQALLLPALHHRKATYTLHGGTDVRWSPPIDFTRYALLSLLESFGNTKLSVERRGFYPQGGGRVVATLGAKREQGPLTLIERGNLDRVTAYCVADRQLMQRGLLEDVENSLRFLLSDLSVPVMLQSTYLSAQDPGWGVVLVAEHSLGARRTAITASILGEEAADVQEACERVSSRLRERLAAPGAIDEHLADQLLPFLALHGGEITVTRVSNHVRAAMAVCERFTSASFTVDGHRIAVRDPQESDASSISV